MSGMADAAWLIPVPTLAAFTVIALGARRSASVSGLLTIAAVFLSFLMSVRVTS